MLRGKPPLLPMGPTVANHSASGTAEETGAKACVVPEFHRGRSKKGEACMIQEDLVEEVGPGRTSLRDKLKWRSQVVMKKKIGMVLDGGRRREGLGGRRVWPGASGLG